MIFPRIIAVAEIGWTNLTARIKKDFERRINNAYVRSDEHNVNYHIPDAGTAERLMQLRGFHR